MNTLYIFLFGNQKRKYAILAASVAWGFGAYVLAVFLFPLYHGLIAWANSPSLRDTFSDEGVVIVAVYSTIFLFLLLGFGLAFEEAREEKVSKLPTLHGTVKWFNSTRGFGYITPDTGSRVRFELDGIEGLRKGERVQYKLLRGRVKDLKRIGTKDESSDPVKLG